MFEEVPMKIWFPDLPYAKDALEPYYSQRTIEYHYDRHHRGYFEKTKAAIQGTDYETLELDDIIKAAASRDADRSLFQNAAQIWNHTLFWQSMRPNGGGQPKGDLARLIERDFGSYADCKAAIKKAATGQFGSGWAWLIYENEKLRILATGNADNPLLFGGIALLTVDVWEHAYYLDYQNERDRYVDSFLTHLANWDNAAQILEKQRSSS